MPAKPKTKPKETDLSEPPIDEITEKQEDKKKKNKPKKKGSFPLIPILILLLIIGAVVAIMVFNVFNIREKYIMPYLRNAPLIGSLMPTAPPGSENTESEPAVSQAELLAQVESLTTQLQQAQADLKTAADQNAADAETIRVLRANEVPIEEYRQIKAAFDSMIVNGDPNAYAQFYASVSPENAERLYKEAITGIQYTSDEKKNASRIAEMSPDAAAAALEQLLTTDSNLVVRLLSNMDNAHVADIYNEMTPANVAVVTRLLAPTPVPVIAVQTAPPLPSPSPTTAPTPQPVDVTAGETP